MDAIAIADSELRSMMTFEVAVLFAVVLFAGRKFVAPMHVPELQQPLSMLWLSHLRRCVVVHEADVVAVVELLM